MHLRDLFARTTTAMSIPFPQHDRRLNHREAGRHLPQQFGGSRLDFGDFAFRMEGCAAVLSRDGQGGALLRDVAKLDKFEDNTVSILVRSFWDVQQLSAAMAAALITCTRGEVATLVRRILSVSHGSNMNTTWEVADVRKPLISACRLLERGHKLVLDEKPRIQCKNGDIIPLERTGSLFAVRLWIPKGFHGQG